MSINIIQNELQEASKVLANFISSNEKLEAIDNASNLIVDSIKNGGKIISCGNGGSMADAIHFAEELTGKFRNERRAIPAMAISDPGYISCVSNDYGYENVFSRYVEAFGKEKDVLLAISTSGNSKNILNAVKIAKEKGMKVISLTGKNGGELANKSTVEIRVDHFGFADRIQEIHIKVIHILIQLIEKGLNLWLQNHLEVPYKELTL